MANEIRMSDEALGVTLLWRSGHTIRVLDAKGNDVGVHTVYVSTANDEDEKNVRASMRRILAEMRNE